MLSFVLMVGAVVVMYQGRPVGEIVASLPHPYGECRQDRELAARVIERLQGLLSEEVDLEAVKAILIRENLAVDYPYDWCAARGQLRPTLVPWDQNIWSKPIIIPLPPQRPLLTARAAQPRARQVSVTIPVKLTGAVPLPPLRPRGT
jgi:hypothetical protein